MPASPERISEWDAYHNHANRSVPAVRMLKRYGAHFDLLHFLEGNFGHTALPTVIRNEIFPPEPEKES